MEGAFIYMEGMYIFSVEGVFICMESMNVSIEVIYFFTEKQHIYIEKLCY